MSFEIILHEPEQPGNTGAIGRTCICAGAGLHLIHPLGFLTDEKSVRRAGLDYWPRLRVAEYENFEDFQKKHVGARIWFLTTKAHRTIDEGDYQDGDFLMFGKESAGLPEELLAANPDRCVRIPMAEGERSLNLSNAVAIALFEALRHTGYAGLEKQGELHRLRWQDESRTQCGYQTPEKERQTI